MLDSSVTFSACLGVVWLRRAKDSHYAGPCGLRASSHIQWFGGQPQSINADHRSQSRIHAAHDAASSPVSSLRWRRQHCAAPQRESQAPGAASWSQLLGPVQQVEVVRRLGRWAIVSFAMVCMIFIVHTMPQQSVYLKIKMALPDAQHRSIQGFQLCRGGPTPGLLGLVW